MKLALLPRLILRSMILPAALVCVSCSARPPFQKNISSIMPNAANPPSVASVLESGQPAMHLEAFPRQGFAPLSVTLHAKLDGVAQNDPNFACLYQVWEFGDGGVSGEKTNCPNDATKRIVETEFVREHVFKKSGTYLIQFRLGDNQIVTKRIAVVVYERY